jgi:hypothetical protein
VQELESQWRQPKSEDWEFKMFILFKKIDESYQFMSKHESLDEAHSHAKELKLYEYRIEHQTLFGSSVVFEIELA